MPGILDMLGSRGGQTAAGGLLGLLAGGPVGALAGAAGGRAFGNLSERAANRRTAAQQELDARALEISAERQRQDAVRQQQEAMRALPGLLGSVTVSDNLMGPPRPNEMRETDQRLGMLGALTQLAPNAAGTAIMQQLFPTQQKPTGVAADLVSLGVEPTPENAIAYTSALSRARNVEDPNAALERESLMANLAKTRFEMERMTRDMEQEARERNLTAARREAAIAGTLESGRTILQSVDALEGTSLEPGTLGLPAWQALKQGQALFNRLRGRDDLSAQQQAELEALDNLDSAASDMVINLALGAGLTSATALNLYTDAKADLDSQPGSIRRVIAKAMRGVLREAELTGVDVPKRQEIESLLGQLEGKRSTAGAADFRWDPAQGRLVPNG